MRLELVSLGYVMEAARTGPALSLHAAIACCMCMPSTPGPPSIYFVTKVANKSKDCTTNHKDRVAATNGCKRRALQASKAHSITGAML